MKFIIALAGLDGESTEDELWFDAIVLLGGVIKALFLPIMTYDHPVRWMIFLQPVVILGGLAVVHVWMRASKLRWFKRVFLYATTYCLLMFVTNMAAREARGMFSVAGDMIKKARLIREGRGWSRDTRP